MNFPFLTGLARQPRQLFRWLLAVGLFALAVFDVVAWLSYQAPAASLRIEARSSVATVMQVYYDLGDGITEAHSVVRPLSPEGGMQTLLFPLPTAPVKRIRLDPLNGAGTVFIRSISLVRDQDGAVVRPFELESLEAGFEIARISNDLEGAEVETPPNATDPQLGLPLDAPLTSAASAWERVRSLLWLDGWVFAVFYGVLYLAVFGWPPRPRLLTRAVAWLAPAARWFPNGWAICLFVLPVGCVAALLAARQADSYYLEVSLTCDRPVTMQFYFDSGDGYVEEHSTQVSVERITTPRVVRVAIPAREVKAVRFDPAKGPVAMRVSEMSIRSEAEDWMGAHPLYILDLRSLWPIQQMKELVHEDDATIRLLVEDAAVDPATGIVLPAPVALGINGAYVLRRTSLLAAGWLALWIAVVEVGYLFVRFGGAVRVWPERVRARWQGLTAVQMVWAVAAVSAGLSCYPVLFCGKSFASPNFSDGTFQLYGRFPTLPGTTDADLENGNGADTGVMAWQATPYAVVESRALWRDHELPLWNRYNYTGLPLLGQGQSMVGDPLHLLVLAAGGRAWAWDAKFVLAKVLFCAGVGLLVLAASESVGAALLLTFSSAFLGFFVYRLNHPAVFSLCYGPWILLAWVRIVQAAHWREVLGWAAGGTAASLVVANSGSFPEAFALVLYLNACGVLLLLLAHRPVEVKFRRLFVLAAAMGMFALVAAPLLVSFFDLLKHSVTDGDGVPARLSPGAFLGLFDDIFYRQLAVRENVLAPSTNFFVLAGVAMAMSRFKRLVGDPLFTGVFLSALLPAAVVFGVVPPAVAEKLPLGRDIVHPEAVYSSVLIIHLLVLAGFGFRQCLLLTPRGRWLRDALVAAGAVGALFYAFYVATSGPASGDSPPVAYSPFFRSYVPILVVAALLVPPVLRRLRFRGPTVTSALLLALCLFLLHWRQGIQLHGDFSRYTAVLPDRLDLLAPSPAVNFLRADRDSPFRAAGFGGSLHGGYGAMAGIEGIDGADALQSPYINEINSLGLKFEKKGAQDIADKSRLAATKRFYDLLNVRYLAALPQDSLDDVPGLRRIGRMDLDVYRNEGAWPRAFFTDRLEQYEGAPQFISQVESGDGGPFATIEKSEFQRFPELAGKFAPARAGRTVVPATNYRLTNNRTSFEVQAPKAGLIVLTEAYFAGNVSAQINGRSARVLRVNHAFRGLLVDGPGLYRVTFNCRPAGFALMLGAWALGMTVLAGVAFWLWRTRPAARATEPMDKLAHPAAPALEQQAARARSGDLTPT